MKLIEFIDKFFNLAREVFFLTDLSGNFIDISPSIFYYSGYKREELIGKNISIGFLNPDETKNIRKILNEKGKVCNRELVLKRKDGEIKYATTNVEFVYNKKNLPEYIIGVVSDITFIKLQIEILKIALSVNSRKEFLEKIANLLRFIFNADHVIVVNIDFLKNSIQLKARSTNKELLNLIDKLKVDFHHIKRFQKELEYLKKEGFIIAYHDTPTTVISEENRKYHFEKWNIKSGLWLYFPVNNNQNYVIAIFHIKRKRIWNDNEIKFFRSIKEIIRLSIEKFNLFEESKKLSELITQMDSSVVITDIDGNIKFVNPAFEKVTGYKFNEVYNKNPRILKSNYHSKTFYKNLWDTIISGNVWKGEFVNKRKDGKLYYENSVIFPVYSEDKISGFCKVGIDITKQKEFEKQMINSQKLKAIGQVTANIAHDFNNILTIIQGYTEISLSKINDEKIKNNLKKIINSVEKAKLIIKRLIKTPFSEKIYPINISLFIKDNYEGFKTLIRDDIDFILNLKSDKKVLISPVELEQILINLIVNSNQAIEQNSNLKEKKIVIETDSNKENVILKVKDTGIGIDKENLNKIFEPFYTLKEKGKGTGLGLFIVKNIVEKYNGKIEVKSKSGEFTEFKICFPVAIEDFSFMEKFKKTINFEKIRGKEITIIEDNYEILNLYSEFLKDLGFNVYGYSDEMKFLSDLKEKRINPYLVIIDIILTKMSGIELAEKIFEINNNIKFLFISGFTSTINVPKNIRDKSDFLAKPFTIEALLEKISRIG